MGNRRESLGELYELCYNSSHNCSSNAEFNAFYDIGQTIFVAMIYVTMIYVTTIYVTTICVTTTSINTNKISNNIDYDSRSKSILTNATRI